MTDSELRTALEKLHRESYGWALGCCTQKMAEADYLTFSHRKHTLRGGLQLEYENNRNQSANNFNGTYFFVSLDQYRAVRPTQFTINRGAPFVRHTQTRATWFVQDDWRVSQSLTLSVGLRHEFQRHLPDKVNFAPRFSLAWSPFRNRKTTIRAGSVTANLNISKTIRFGRRAVTAAQNPPGNESSRVNLQLSTQITNLFNHVNPGLFTGVLTSPFFYRSNRVGPARQMEFNLRLSF